MTGTREVFVIDTFVGPRTYLDVRDLASAVIAGVGFTFVVGDFTKATTVRVLTDGTTPSLDLTDVCKDAALACQTERTATNGTSARASVHRRHTDALALRIMELRANARIAAAVAGEVL